MAGRRKVIAVLERSENSVSLEASRWRVRLSVYLLGLPLVVVTAWPGHAFAVEGRRLEFSSVAQESCPTARPLHVADIDGVSADRCKLYGARVESSDGFLAVLVPRAGTSVNVSAFAPESVTKEFALDVLVDFDGTIRARIGGSAPPLKSGAAPTRAGASLKVPAECFNGGYDLANRKWFSSYQWRINSSTFPSGIGASSSIITSIRSGLQNITTMNNDCGFPDEVGMSASYLGTTSALTPINNNGDCTGPADGVNVVAFGTTGGGYGITCSRSHLQVGQIFETMTEVDIKMSSGTSWTLTPGSGCVGQRDLESALTHEFGHAAGLNHWSSYTSLTMYPGSYFPPCDNGRRTLSKGDMDGLKVIY